MASDYFNRLRHNFEWAYDQLIAEGKDPRPAAMDALDWAYRNTV